MLGGDQRSICAREREAGSGFGYCKRGQPFDRASDGQPGLAASLRPGAGRNAEQFRWPSGDGPATRSYSTGWPVVLLRRAGRSRCCTGRSCCLRHTGKAAALIRRVTRLIRRARFWRMNRRRLDVEAWRDAILAVAGRLDAKLGGPSVNLDQATNGAERCTRRSAVMTSRGCCDFSIFPTQTSPAAAELKPWCRSSSFSF